ncbi:hypothetical protein [Micromonospora sp. NPDC049891]|uniref:hypothetical protein n=1 Tax=Micromonospora sp. NPDC049891 TaxID=3155655 RepID=UPI00340E06E9
MNISAIRSALAESVASVTPELNTYGYVPDSVAVPCFYVGGVEIDYDVTMGRGSDELSVTCVVLVSANSDASGQEQLDAYLNGSGASSLKAAIEADETLGGECFTLAVSRAQGYGFHKVGTTDYLGAELVVNITGDGS